MKTRRTSRMVAGIGMAAWLVLGIASSVFADDSDPFATGLVPGEPLAEEELVLFEGKGSTDISGNIRPDNGPTGPNTPLHEQTQTRAESTVERLQSVEDRLSDGVGSRATGATGAIGDGRINATDIESRMSERLDALVDHAFEAETRTHWTIWH